MDGAPRRGSWGMPGTEMRIQKEAEDPEATPPRASDLRQSKYCSGLLRKGASVCQRCRRTPGAEAAGVSSLTGRTPEIKVLAGSGLRERGNYLPPAS